MAAKIKSEVHKVMDHLATFISSQTPSDQAKYAVRDYFAWHLQYQTAGFIPSEDDHVDLRTYLLYLHANGADPSALEDQVSALKLFYLWAQREGVILHNPFDETDFLNPFLTSELVNPRQQTIPSDPNEREVEWLRALDEIVDQLISSVDIQNVLDSTLRTLLKVMKLQTGWISMLTNSHLRVFSVGDSPSRGFALGSAFGLPPGLKRDDHRFLCQPPACHCQRLLLKGRLTRAVNIVECTRIQDFLRATGENQGFQFHASVPLISQGKPLGLINVATNQWQFLTYADLRFLSAVSSRLVAALERAQFYEVAESQRNLLENELKVAREVQAGLMPREMPDIPGFSLAYAWHPGREVSGDFYDIFPLAEGCWGIMIGDVADKGTAAALYMAMVHSLIRSGTLRNHSPASVLKEVNQTIQRQSSSGIYVTIFLAVLDSKKQTLRYANAGHNPPMLRRASGNIEELARTGRVVGMFNQPQWSEATITLEDGDTLILFTDGVTEARRKDKEYYEENRLATAIVDAPQKADEMLAHIEADLNIFIEKATEQDDITFLVLSKD
jgi:serine phosphatase RsbU (regulator of sigma subunit)